MLLLFLFVLISIWLVTWVFGFVFVSWDCLFGVCYVWFGGLLLYVSFCLFDLVWVCWFEVVFRTALFWLCNCYVICVGFVLFV